jgi:hypothetical protein
MKKFGLIIVVAFLSVLAASCNGFFEDLFKNIVITSPQDGTAVRYDTISVSVSWSDPDIESISCSGQVYQVVGSEQSHTFYNISLFAGWNTISVSVSGSGIFFGDSVNVFYDPLPPNLLIVSPSDYSEVFSSSVTVHGIASDNYGLSSLQYKGDAGHYGSLGFEGDVFNLFVQNLKDDTAYTFAFVLTDEAGWMVQKSVHFTCRIE